MAAIKAHKVSAVGLQEVQPDQMAGLLRGTGFEVYPGPDVDALNRVNPIMWDPAVFEFVSGDRFTITFMGRARPQPILRLRHRVTGRELYVVNTHPSAGGGVYAGDGITPPVRILVALSVPFCAQARPSAAMVVHRLERVIERRVDAERLLLELKGRIAAPRDPHGEARAEGSHADVAHALVALGYSEREADAASRRLPAGIDVSDGIRQALKSLVKA